MNYIIVIKIIYPGFKEVLSSGRGEGPRVLNRFKVVIFVEPILKCQIGENVIRLRNENLSNWIF